MALTPSTMLALGTSAPDFHLSDVVTGELVSLATFGDRQVLLIIFGCQHCPFVKHVQAELANLGRDYASQSVGIVFVSSNDITTHPSDSPAHLKVMAVEQEFSFPVCFDETQAVAKAYTAACTPDFFVFDRDRHLAYRGQLDDSRPSNGVPVTGRDLRAAMDALLTDKTVNAEQHPSIGCNIKWTPGQEPAYAR